MFLKKVRQRRLNVTLRRVHEIIVAMEKQKANHTAACVCARVLMTVGVGAQALVCA
jgi:hypothetical protein